MTIAMAPEDAMSPTEKALVIAALPERGINHSTDRYHRAHGGMRHCAEEFGCDDRRYPERPPYPADQRNYPHQDTSSDAALRHDFAGQHEKRNGKQWVVVEASEYVDLDGSRWQTCDQHDHNGCHEKSDKYWEAENQKYRGKNEIHEIR